MASNFMTDSAESHLTYLQETFELAAKYLRNIIGDLETEQLLYFYARFKQAKEGPCSTSRPGFFDFQGKQKWDAWHKLGDMKPVLAMEQYVTAMNDIDPEWQLKADAPENRSSKDGQWVSVSTMQPEADLDDADKTVFDWCKEGDIKRTQSLLTKINVNDKDDEGMTLLHWACDRGLEDMARILLDHQADVNSQDNEGQTPLHYAAACEHVAVVETLLAGGADVSIRDTEGLTPAEAADSQAMVELLLAR